MLRIEEIPENERILPEWKYRLIETDSGLYVPGQFTGTEASQIVAEMEGADWKLDKRDKPNCSRILIQVLEKVCGGLE